ncbi:2-amino-4-hydroxy-6-hydroxymethyldihydropteridinepyrophosphokinase [Candidatus Zixiibacteriota bacterium]|nr:2-amino-4-hydroxy-6-hydroxymethyldihydropteridinepyrophosphokinase [candidate division Zixibacteria bacterium]
MKSTVYLAFGSNLGDREGNLCKACEMIASMEGFELIECSPIYINPAMEMAEPAPGFLNMVAKGDYAYRPLELLNQIELIEKKLGRADKGGYKPRTIDIDILLFGKEVIETERLSVPHRKLTMRPFFLVPLLQIEPELIHPVTGEKVATYLRDGDQAQMILYKDNLFRNV